MKRHFRSIFLSCLLLTSASAFAQNLDFFATDLGDLGNKFVAQTFQDYTEFHPQGICQTQGPGKRVIVTGYGLFSGVPYNISEVSLPPWEKILRYQ